MPDFDPKLGRQLPPPPATGSEQEVGPGQGTTLAKEAAIAAAHPSEPPHSHEIAPSILRELYLLFRDMLRNGKDWPMLRLSAAILVILVGNMFGQVRLNRWNGAFFDAIEKREHRRLLPPAPGLPGHRRRAARRSSWRRPGCRSASRSGCASA